MKMYVHRDGSCCSSASIKFIPAHLTKTFMRINQILSGSLNCTPVVQLYIKLKKMADNKLQFTDTAGKYFTKMSLTTAINCRNIYNGTIDNLESFLSLGSLLCAQIYLVWQSSLWQIHTRTHTAPGLPGDPLWHDYITSLSAISRYVSTWPHKHINTDRKAEKNKLQSFFGSSSNINTHKDTCMSPRWPAFCLFWTDPRDTAGPTDWREHASLCDISIIWKASAII